MTSYRYLYVMLSLFVSLPCRAQENLWILEGYYGIGHNVKEKLMVKDNAAQMAEFSFSKHADNSKLWHSSMRMPEVGGMVAFVVPSYTSAVGMVLGIGGNAKFWLWKSSLVNGYLRIGGGMGYISKIYKEDNKNRLVSSHFNIFGQIRIGADWRIAKHLELVTAANYNHFSNSGISYPNLGVDMFMGTVGLRYSFEDISNFPKDFMKEKYQGRRHEYSIKYGIGIRETYRGSPQKYAVQMLGLGYAYYIKYANKLTVILNLEYDSHIGNNLETGRVPIKIPIYISDEIVVGRVGASFGVGTYLYYAGGAPSANRVLLRLGVNYYFAQLKLKNNHRMQFYTGAFIKSHAWNANLLEVGIGMNFR